MPIESVIPSNHLILCRLLLLPPSIFTSIKIFSNESVLCIRWSKYWSFRLNISPSNEYSGVISIRISRLDLLAVQGILKSFLQHHSSKSSILRCSDFFIVQLSHPYLTTGKTIALNRQTFVGEVMSLLFNMLSRVVIAFLPGSSHLLNSRLQSPTVMILEPPKAKPLTVSIVSRPSVKSLQTTSAGGHGEKKTLSPCWRECKLVQPLLSTVWRFLKTLKTELPQDLAFPILGMGDGGG